MLSHPFEVAEEEHAVLHNRSAERNTKLIPAQRRDTYGEEVARIQFVIPQELVSRAVQLVGAALDRDIDDCAAGPAEFGRVIGSLDFELFDGVNRGNEYGGAFDG